MFQSIGNRKMPLIFLMIELLTIFIGSVTANSLINHNNGAISSSSSSSASSLSDLNQQQTNPNPSQQYSINKDEDQSLKSGTSHIQMDENDALRILLQNYKLNADYQYNQQQQQQQLQQQQQQYHQSILNPWLRNNEEFIRSNGIANNRIVSSPPLAVTYIQPIFIPYPVLMNPSQNLQYLSSGIPSPTNFGDYEDAMSRGNINRRGGSGGGNVGGNAGSIIDNINYRNSPIYYVRLPPTPYTFLPSLGGYTSAHTSSFNPFIQLNTPIRSFPTYHNQPPTLSSILNLPVNFLANGKPTNVYNLDTTHELPSIAYQQRPYQQLQQQQQLLNRPTNKPIQTNFIRQPNPGTALANLDSKITNLKRQYLFNGRPDDEIYLLPNEFDRWNTNFQNSIPEYF